jgi:hypothetical protein
MLSLSEKLIFILTEWKERGILSSRVMGCEFIGDRSLASFRKRPKGVRVMAKLYFDKSEISQYQGLNEGLLELVEKGMVRLEKQSSFRALYNLEIMGITVYYRKSWRYNDLS